MTNFLFFNRIAGPLSPAADKTYATSSTIAVTTSCMHPVSIISLTAVSASPSAYLLLLILLLLTFMPLTELVLLLLLTFISCIASLWHHHLESEISCNFYYSLLLK